MLAFVLVLLLTAVVVGFIRPVVANETIYIWADGSVEGTTHISSVDNVTYYFTDNINDSIVVQRDNIVIDGAGYTLQGTGNGTGIDLSDRNNVTIKNMKIKEFNYGIWLNMSSDNSIYGNHITESDSAGILLMYSSNNSVYGNKLTANDGYGIGLYESSNNTISCNNASNNLDGIYLVYSSDKNTVSSNTVSKNMGWVGIGIDTSNNNTVSGNTVSNNLRGIFVYGYSNVLFHNNFINNTQHVTILNSTNTWDDGYPSGGNYWSNYTGVDVKSGPNQDQLGSDGIGDTAHDIDGNNTDNYPLIGMFSDFNATSEHHVKTICNSSISDFQFNGTAICFNVTGENGTTGFCRICIPRALMNETYKVFVNGTEVTHTLLPCSNSTHSYLYFTYNHSTQEVEIIPEFPTWTSMIFILIVFTVAIVIYKRKLLKTPTH